jgi:integrase
MATTTFVLKEPNSETETPVFLLFRYKDNRVKLSTEEKILPTFWDKANHRARATKKFPEYSEFNARLENMSSRAKNTFRMFVNDNLRQPNTDEMRDLLSREFARSESNSKKDLFSFIEKFIVEARNRVNNKTGKPISRATLNIYNSTLRMLLEYKKARRRKIDFNTIDLDFYYDFSEYMTKKHNYAVNTVGKYIKTLKSFLTEASERGHNTNYAYKSKRFKVTTEETDSIYLTEKELQEFYELNLSNNPKLDRVRDLFLVGCWTGLRFSDFSTIQARDIKGEFIEVETQKTGERVVIPIHDTVKNVIEKYKGKTENSLPPSISNVKMNLYLKDLGHLLDSQHVKTTSTITKGGVNLIKTYKKYELITTHTARRSFASNLYKDGVPAYTIMKITGHRTEKAFLRYIKITPNESARILQLHWEQKRRTKSASLLYNLM